MNLTETQTEKVASIVRSKMEGNAALTKRMGKIAIKTEILNSCLEMNVSLNDVPDIRAEIKLLETEADALTGDIVDDAITEVMASTVEGEHTKETLLALYDSKTVTRN